MCGIPESGTAVSQAGFGGIRCQNEGASDLPPQSLAGPDVVGAGKLPSDLLNQARI
jgi:hypothetical protein